MGSAVRWNNAMAHAADVGVPNPRPLDDVDWHRRLVAGFDDVRAEWDAFAASGGRLPLLDDLIQEEQGSTEPWRAGLLVAGGTPVRRLADRFPRTTALALSVPGIRSALWSVLTPGAELPEHVGSNAGVLRYHLGVVCPHGAGLRVGDRVVPYREREGVLFDDTVPHSAWNRSDRDRVTLFLELRRPLRGSRDLRNRWTQTLIGQDRRYRGAAARAAEWDLALNLATTEGSA